MVSNDNDTGYVLNALPELQEMRLSEREVSRDLIKAGKIVGMFSGLNLERIIGPMRKVPGYYHYRGRNSGSGGLSSGSGSGSGSNLKACRIVLVTRFKVNVDIGFLQYLVDESKVTIFRIYISKIYRRMNYVGYVYL